MFDSLTVSMLLPVLVVSSMVHVYSISYMSADPHNQRFFAYLSMFTFFMLILVTGDNYLILFVGLFLAYVNQHYMPESFTGPKYFYSNNLMSIEISSYLPSSETIRVGTTYTSSVIYSPVFPP